MSAIPAESASPSNSRETSLSPDILCWIGGLVDRKPAYERAKQAAFNVPPDSRDSLSGLVSAASELFMHVEPVAMPLSRLVWQARSDTPVVIRSVSGNRWVVITGSGWFKVRVALSDRPAVRVTLSRRSLVDLLGLSGEDATVEAGVVYPEYADTKADALCGCESEAGAHGGSHGAHVSPARRFFSVLRAERRDVTLLLTFSAFASVLYLASPLAVDVLVSSLAFGGQQTPYVQAIVVLVLGLLACLSLHAVVGGFQYYVSEILQRRIFVRTAADLAHRLPRIRASALDEVHAPEIVNRFLDVVTLQKTASMLLLDGVNLVFGAVIGMLLLALYHPYLLIFSVVLFVCIGVVVFGLGRGGVRTSIAESRMKYDLVNWFEEIAHFPVLFKGPGGYDLAYERTNRLASAYVYERSRHFRVLMRQICALLFISVLATSGFLVISGYLVVSQQLTLGQLVAGELIVGGLIVALTKFGKTLEAWYDAMASMDKLGHILDLDIERSDGGGARHESGGAEVVVTSVRYGYSEASPLFDGLDFSIPSGGRAAVTGPHGAGMSSLLDLLFGLREPGAGHISIDGCDLRDRHLERLRDEVQLLRRNEIIDGTVVDNLRLGRDEIGLDEVRAALAATGLLEVLLARPEGLGLQLKIGGAPLSGLQRARLLLARALVQRPRLLLVDEILDGFDEPALRELSAVIFDRSRDWTVLIATREPQVLALCDKVVNLAGADASPAKNTKN